jgi:hypothetical protein
LVLFYILTGNAYIKQNISYPLAMGGSRVKFKRGQNMLIVEFKWGHITVEA